IKGMVRLIERAIWALWSFGLVEAGVIILLCSQVVTTTMMVSTGMANGSQARCKRSGWDRSIHRKLLFSGSSSAALGRAMPRAKSSRAIGVAASERWIDQYMAISSGNWISIGRQELNGLMPFS